VRQLADLEGVHVKAVGFENGGRDRGEVNDEHFRIGSTGRATAVFQPMFVRER
jgi:hypothetical protein